MAYDDQNIFAKILRGEIPNATVYETDHILAFRDISPQAPSHILVIPKQAYISIADFSARASDAEKVALMEAIGKVAEMAGLVEGGYRVISNHGRAARQEVPHLHFHILGGGDLGPLVSA